MKLSKWIDGKKFKPANVGFYEIKEYSKFYKCFSMRYWDGGKWSMGWFHECSIKYQMLGISSNQSPTFRGLADKP
jgi:hypothetical protein